MMFLEIAQAPRRFLDLRALSFEYAQRRPTNTRGGKTHRHTQETHAYSKETHTYSKETCQAIFWNGDRALNVNQKKKNIHGRDPFLHTKDPYRHKTDLSSLFLKWGPGTAAHTQHGPPLLLPTWRTFYTHVNKYIYPRMHTYIYSRVKCR